MARTSAARVFNSNLNTDSRISPIKSKVEVMAEVKQHIEEAAMLLRSLGRDYEKSAWVLEDSLQFLGESQSSYLAPVDWASLVQAEELIYP